MAAYTLTASATSRSAPNARRKRKRSSIRKRSPPRKSLTRRCPSARNRTLRNRKRKNQKKRSRKKNPSRQLRQAPLKVHSEGDFLVSQTSLPYLLREPPSVQSFCICPISPIGHRRDHAREDFHACRQYHR